MQVLAAGGHAARECRQQSQERAKERGLARAVGPEHAQHLARFEREVQAAPDGARAVSIVEGVGGEAHWAFRNVAASSTMKTGVPTRAVMTPGGSSVRAMV